MFDYETSGPNVGRYIDECWEFKNRFVPDWWCLRGSGECVADPWKIQIGRIGNVYQCKYHLEVCIMSVFRMCVPCFYFGISYIVHPVRSPWFPSVFPALVVLSLFLFSVCDLQIVHRHGTDRILIGC